MLGRFQFLGLSFAPRQFCLLGIGPGIVWRFIIQLKRSNTNAEANVIDTGWPRVLPCRHVPRVRPSHCGTGRSFSQSALFVNSSLIRRVNVCTTVQWWTFFVCIATEEGGGSVC